MVGDLEGRDPPPDPTGRGAREQLRRDGPVFEAADPYSEPMRFLLKLLAYAAGLAAAAWLLEGIYFLGTTDGGSKELDAKVLPLLGVSLILAVVNTIVTPIIKMLSFPLLLVTLGLFMLVINALMLLLTAEIAENVGLNFQVENFYAAGIGAVIVTIVTWALDAALDD